MQQTVDAYCTLLRRADALKPVGLYLVGSVVLGDFQHGRSDVDVVAVLPEPPDATATEALAVIHRTMAERGEPTLDAVYLTVERLRAPDQDALPTPFVVKGAFHADRACPELHAVLRQCLAEHGRVVFGPPVATLGVPVDRCATARHVRSNLRSYWQSWIDEAAETLAARRPHGDAAAAALSWGVLGVARMAATLETGAIVSKSAAGRWAIARFPDWRAPLELALAERRGMIERASLDAADHVLAFMRFIVSRDGPEP